MRDPDLLWKDLVDRFAQQSKCQRRGVGAILVDGNSHMFGQGFNGAPAGSKCESCPRCATGNLQSGTKLEFAICAHAEANAIANAAKAGRSTIGATLFCTTYPCAECAKLIVSAGVVEVVYDQDYQSPLTEQIFKNANVKVRRFHNA